MKVGILTYHGAHNYGSALQAYALFQAVKKAGYQAEIINYRTDRQDDLYRLYSKPSSIIAILRNVQSLIYKKKLTEHHAKFGSFLSDHAILSGKEIRRKDDLKGLNDKYDCFICGSDQIWNPNCVDFDSSYLLDFVKDKKTCFSYAPSIASDHLGEKWHDLFRDMLIDYSALSVREKTGAEIITSITGRRVEVVLDPVFLLGKADWSPFFADRKGGYILCYFIGDIPGMRDYAVALSEKYKKHIIVINKNLRDMKMKCEKRYESGPADFVDLVAHADAVCTNSFHAVAFSLIFDRELHVFVDNANPNTARSRIIDILGMLGMDDRLVSDASMLLPGMSGEEFKYHEELDDKIGKSKLYLQNSLNIVEEYSARGIK